MVEIQILTSEQIQAMRAQYQGFPFEMLRDDHGILRVGFARIEGRLEMVVQYKDHYGQVWSEYPIFRPWFRMEFYCEKCKSRHMVERFSKEETRELEIRFWK